MTTRSPVNPPSEPSEPSPRPLTRRPGPPPTADLLFPTHTGTAPRRPPLGSEPDDGQGNGRSSRPLLPQVQIQPWPDAVIDRLGVDPRSGYVEHFWLGLVGPASVLLIRHLADRFDAEPDGFELDLAATAALLGLGTGLGRWGPMQRTLHRCVGFGFARRWSDSRVVVRRRLPPLTRAQLDRLPTERQRQHARWLEAQAATSAAPEANGRLAVPARR
ncbi:MAG: hypothetical protein AB7O92_31965 [Acidimicrobiia bacterium]